MLKSCFSWFQTKNWILPWSNFWKWCPQYNNLLQNSTKKILKLHRASLSPIIFRPWSLTDMICIQDVTFTPRLCNKYIGNPPFQKHTYLIFKVMPKNNLLQKSTNKKYWNCTNLVSVLSFSGHNHSPTWFVFRM